MSKLVSLIAVLVLCGSVVFSQNAGQGTPPEAVPQHEPESNHSQADREKTTKDEKHNNKNNEKKHKKNGKKDHEKYEQGPPPEPVPPPTPPQ